MDALVRKIEAGSVQELAADIDAFRRDYGSKTSFDELNVENLREKFWTILFSHLNDDSDANIHEKCLSTLRILSRDKTDLDQLLTAERLAMILDLAHLSKENIEKDSYNNDTIESIKILCNLVFNSPKVQQELPNTPCLRALVARMKAYSAATAQELKFFDCRLVFLITALNTSSRKLLKELGGDSAMTKLLTDICTRCEAEDEKSCKADDVSLSCEVLKALFNLYINAQEAESDPLEKSSNLVFILYKLLVHNCTENADELQKNIANLLIVMPFASYKSIIPQPSKQSRVVFQNVDMSAISVLLDYLDRRLNNDENLLQNLSPIVSAFIRLVKVEKPIRRYVRLQILPPLKDVMTRPEEGTTLRAKLCKLLTHPVAELKDLVAEFLFILCKENVCRMIKYTGYGNAAGMFANKGLLAPKTAKEADSSESEESDTEEYEKVKDQINPVTGCYEHPKPSPLDGMTDEQKEYEAMQLVSLVDKLTRSGIVQPCRIGEDGKPKPIEHVLELQEELAKQNLHRRESESD